ncbi:hypothetical protein [Photobacterium leiognathi]|uniref:hypothetical protein n=1 Tax=Photobacterium leiognathi TaxID=553611 RepID=UPI0029818B60|nr:hypothetical protein [Photobacterium leiognathi]
MSNRNRVSIKHVSGMGRAFCIDDVPISIDEVHAHIRLYLDKDNSTPLLKEVVDLFVRQQILPGNYNGALANIGISSTKKVGEKTDVTGQYLCVLFSDILNEKDSVIAEVLGFITEDGQDYQRMIRSRKQKFYKHIKEQSQLTFISNNRENNLEDEITVQLIQAKYIAQKKIAKLSNKQLCKQLTANIQALPENAIPYFSSKIITESKNSLM